MSSLYFFERNMMNAHIPEPSKNLSDFVREKAVSRTVHFVVTGGGSCLLNILSVPGCSSVFSGASVPYNQKEEERLISEVTPHESLERLRQGCFGYVSPWMTKQYAEAIRKRHAETGHDTSICVINASLTTTRWRRGKNEAFFGIIDSSLRFEDARLFHLSLNKITEEQHAEYSNAVEGSHLSLMIAATRMTEDTKVGQSALALLTNDVKYIQSRSGEMILEPDERIHEVEPGLNFDNNGNYNIGGQVFAYA